MAQLPKRSAGTLSAATPNPSASPTPSPAAAAEKPVGAPGAAQPSANAPAGVVPAAKPLVRKATPVAGNASEEEFSAQLAQREKEIVEFLRRPETLDAVRRANPEIADDAIGAAVAYVTDQTDREQYIKLVRCVPQTVLESVRKLAAVGLVASRDLQTGFLVPRRREGELVCTPVPGVRGIEGAILAACPEATIEANAIRDQDTIEVSEGTHPSLVFRRNFRPDRAKTNPIIGSYCVIREKPDAVTRYQIKTVAIEERKEQVPGGRSGEQQTVWITHDGRRIDPGRMGAETACRYTAQRACMREVARTWLKGNRRIQDMLTLEDESFRNGEDLPGAQQRNARPRTNTTPTIVATKAAAAANGQGNQPPAEIPAGEAAGGDPEKVTASVGM